MFFLLPIGLILYSAFRKDGAQAPRPGHAAVRRDARSFTGVEPVGDRCTGIYRTSMVNSIELSAFTAVIGAVFGMFLAYAVVTSRSGALRQIVIAAAAVMANFGGIPLAFLFIATVG